MFEHYMSYQYANPRLQRMRGVAALLSAAITLSMVTFAWAANKMDIARVDPPTSDYLVFQLSLEDPPPPPGPPPPPAHNDRVDAGNHSEVSEIPDEAPPEESLAPPREAPTSLPKLRGGGSKRGGVPGIPGSSIGVPGSPFGGGIGAPGVRRPHKDRADAPPPSPIQAVLAQGIFTPKPDQKRLGATKAGMFDRRPCTNKTFFCVDPRGKVVDVRTTGRCYDPQVNAICRDAVKHWRFKPFIVGGVAKRTCSTVHFDLEFAG